MTTDHTNDGTFTLDEVHQAMDYAREHGDSRIVDDEGVTRLSFHVPHLDDPPHEPGCNCGESNECPTYAPGLPTEPPPLPDGWRIDVRNGVSYLHCGGYSDAAAWVADGQFVLNVGHVIPEACARHLLGLTAPVADVRALEAFADDLDKRAYHAIVSHKGRFIDTHGREYKEGAYVCNTLQGIAREIRVLLTGKGAPR